MYCIEFRQGVGCCYASDEWKGKRPYVYMSVSDSEGKQIRCLVGCSERANVRKPTKKIYDRLREGLLALAKEEGFI